MNLRILMAAAMLAAPCLARAQTMQKLVNPAPDGVQISYQLTDGTVLAQGNNSSDWWVLTPDITGSYVNGTWKQVGSLQQGYVPSAMASQVLADGRVLIEGGEYNNGQFALTNLGAVYDPVAQTWTPVQPPPGWENIGDSPSVVLPDGTFLLGDKLHMRASLLNPATMTWTKAKVANKIDFNAEEGWTLLPDGTVLTVDVLANPQSERYLPAKGKWKWMGSTKADLAGPPCCKCGTYPPHNHYYCPPGEVGPAVLRPDGTVFATGAIETGAKAGHTAIYTPGKGWKPGPDFPNGDDAGDNFATLLPDGDVLVQGTSGQIYDWNGTTFTSTNVLGNGNSLMILPTGQVLVGGEGVINSTGTYQAAWQPTIATVAATLTRGSTYPITGTQFNGLSQANAFGDELQTSTNYPLVRIVNTGTGHVFYARTHGHSTMGVATGNTVVSTNFDVPAGMETGASSLVVVANGIPSAAVSVTVQ